MTGNPVSSRTLSEKNNLYTSGVSNEDKTEILYYIATLQLHNIDDFIISIVGLM